jgi:hypothetical protein
MADWILIRPSRRTKLVLVFVNTTKAVALRGPEMLVTILVHTTTQNNRTPARSRCPKSALAIASTLKNSTSLKTIDNLFITPWAQEVRGSNPRAPTNLFIGLNPFQSDRVKSCEAVCAKDFVSVRSITPRCDQGHSVIELAPLN